MSLAFEISVTDEPDSFQIAERKGGFCAVKKFYIEHLLYKINIKRGKYEISQRYYTYQIQLKKMALILKKHLFNNISISVKERYKIYHQQYQYLEIVNYHTAQILQRLFYYQKFITQLKFYNFYFGIANMTNIKSANLNFLKKLSFVYCYLSKDVFQYLSTTKLKYLTSLIIKCTKISNKGFKSIMKIDMPRIQVLVLLKTGITALIIKYAKQYKYLRQLSIWASFEYIKHQDLDEIQKLGNPWTVICDKKIEVVDKKISTNSTIKSIVFDQKYRNLIEQQHNKQEQQKNALNAVSNNQHQTFVDFAEKIVDRLNKVQVVQLQHKLKKISF